MSDNAPNTAANINADSDSQDSVIAAKPCDKTLDYLLRRRSVPLKQVGEPGPSAEQIQTILKAAMRVPDHGRLFPWHFMVFEGDARKELGNVIADIYAKGHPSAPEEKLDIERGRLTRAPLVIGVISRIREGKHPAWEQILSAGAACQNLCLAANASGFATNWLTEWFSYDAEFKTHIGLDELDHIAGLIHIGTALEQPEERDRPEPAEIVTYWSKDSSPNKGNKYGRAGMGMPKSGFEYNHKK